MCIKCWCFMIESSNLDCLFSLHSPSTSILNPKCSILHPPTSNLLYPTSNLLHHLFLLYPNSKVQDICLKIVWFLTKCLQAPLAPLASFFQVWSSLSQSSIKSKIFFYRNCLAWFSNWKFHIRREILSLSELNIKSKNLFIKVAQFSSHLVTQQSFCHILN